MDNINDHFFQVSVKGLYFREDGKLLMVQEDTGYWELPGGRIQKGENFIEALKREVKEETGLDCEVLEEYPSIVYPSVDKEGRGRIMVFFKIKLDNLNFTPSAECQSIEFYTKEEMEQLQIYPQTKPLLNLF